MEEVLREPFQRTSCYFNCGRSSSQRRFSNHNWWLHSYRSWSGNTKPQELKRSWYWLCHVCRSHQAWWWEATRQASPLGKALSAFWKLDRVWTSRASLQQKMQLFIASALSVLLYGCESWVLTSDLCRQIDSFQTSCIRIILGVSRTDHVSNEEVYDRTGTVSFSQLLQALQIPPDKLPNVVLKKCADALAPSLTFFINLTCVVGCTPLNENVLTSPR